MTARVRLQPITKAELEILLRAIDEDFLVRGRTAHVTLLGGGSIILLGFRDRATLDLDIAATADAAVFLQICRDHGVPVDIVAIASTVDLNHCSTVPVFRGKALTIASVTAPDLVKLKLERFRKHDPEDIEAILAHEQISYEEFSTLVADMRLDYIGNEREVVLSARIIVERVYPDRVEEFAAALPLE